MAIVTYVVVISTFIVYLYAVSLNQEDAIDFLKQYDIEHIWETLKDSGFDDTDLWHEIDQEMLKNMKIADVDRIKFKKMQNGWKDRNKSELERNLDKIMPIVELIQSNSGLLASVAGFLLPAFAWLYSKMIQKKVTDESNVQPKEKKKEQKKSDEKVEDKSESNNVIQDVKDTAMHIAKDMKGDGYQFEIFHSLKAIDIQGHYNKVGAYLVLKELMTKAKSGYGCNQIFLTQRVDDEYFTIYGVNSGLYWTVNAKGYLIQSEKKGLNTQEQQFRFLCVGKDTSKYLIQCKKDSKFIFVKGKYLMAGDKNNCFFNCIKVDLL